MAVTETPRLQESSRPKVAEKRESAPLAPSVLPCLLILGFLVLLLVAGTGSASGARDSRLAGSKPAPLSPGSPFPISTWTNDQLKPAVAYNSFEDDYLVVWENATSSTNHDIYAQRVTSGTLVGDPFKIAGSEASESNPAVAYHPTAYEYLVVWEQQVGAGNRDIYAQRLTGTGNPTGTQILVTTLSNDEASPDVAFTVVQPAPQNSPASSGGSSSCAAPHGTGDCPPPGPPSGYLVVWEHWQDNGGSPQADIHGQYIDSSGALLGAPIVIDSDTEDESAPAVAYWDGMFWHGNLVVWQDQQASPADYDIHGQRVGTDGSLAGGEILISTWEYDQLKPDLACASKCLAVWEDHHWGWGTDWDIYAQALWVGPDGATQLEGGNSGVSWVGSKHRENPAIERFVASSEFWVVWEFEYSSTDQDIYLRWVDEDANLASDELAVSRLVSNETGPALASGDANYLVVWEDGRNSGIGQAIDIYGEGLARECTMHCDCPQGLFCYYGTCLQDPKMPVYCCDRPGCPPGRWCFHSDGTKDTCAEDPDHVCRSACDCGTAHCCKDNICVKDIDDPWNPGGTEIGPPCEEGVDATYCCEDPLCHAGKQANDGAGDGGLFRCYSQMWKAVSAFCGGKPCYGTACECDPGESCLDTYGDASPGRACFLLEGGTCVSNAVAEAAYGWSPGEMLPCGPKGCFPGQSVETGWQTGGPHAYERLLGICGSCGNGICDPDEFPGYCPQDCDCGDGRCAPSEVESCTADCGACGDGTCQDWETHASCVPDCPTAEEDAWCQVDEFWSTPEDCGCPDAPYFPGIFAACRDVYFRGVYPLDPETCDSCPEEYVAPSQASALVAPNLDQEILFARRYGGSTGPKAPYFAPDLARSILLKDGYLYIAGQTYSTDFATTGSHNGNWDAFVLKLDAQGDPLFSRYLGEDSGLGHDNDAGRDIAVDEAGRVYVTGSMGVIRISPDGSETYTYTNAVYDAEGGYGIALDSSDAIYVTGSEATGVLKLNADGSVAYHNTTLGGTGHAIAVDGSGQAYVAGSMGVLKLSADGASLGFAMPLPGTGYAIALRHGQVYVAGFASSGGPPVSSGAYDTSFDPSGDAFLAILDTDGNVQYATYLGGDQMDQALDVEVDELGYVYVTGFTSSPDFPTTADALYPAMHGSGDAFLAVLSPEGNGAADLIYSTFIGGNDPAVPPYLTPDRAFGLALDDENGDVYLVGEAGSADFPTTDASSAGFTDAFVIKLDPFETVQAGFAAAPRNGTPPLTVSFTNASTGDYTDSLWALGDGSTSTEENPAHTYALPGVYSVALTVSGPGGTDTETKTGYVTVAEKARVYLPIILRQSQ